MIHDNITDTLPTLPREIAVLDYGFVRLIDTLGNDARIVQSARVSYGTGTKTKRQDKNLIRYLMRNYHTSPFEQVVFTFHIKAPIFIARQTFRHRTARINEISARYSILPNECYIPQTDYIAFQSEDNKQARADEPVALDIAHETQEIMRTTYDTIYAQYEKLLSMGIAREIARTILPVGIYTEWYWQIDLHNILHFLKLRIDAHAQKEIRDYAHAILQLIEPIVPISVQAWKDFSLSKI